MGDYAGYRVDTSIVNGVYELTYDWGESTL